MAAARFRVEIRFRYPQARKERGIAFIPAKMEVKNARISFARFRVLRGAASAACRLFFNIREHKFLLISFQDGIHISRAAVLIIQIIGMLPNVNCQHGFLTFHPGRRALLVLSMLSLLPSQINQAQPLPNCRRPQKTTCGRLPRSQSCLNQAASAGRSTIRVPGSSNKIVIPTCGAINSAVLPSW